MTRREAEVARLTGLYGPDPSKVGRVDGTEDDLGDLVAADLPAAVFTSDDPLDLDLETGDLDRLAEIVDRSSSWEEAIDHARPIVALAWLVKEGASLRVPCSRYGYDSQSCAPVALAVAEIVEEATGEPMSTDDLDHAMGLVVNDHDDPEDLIRSHGSPAQIELLDN